VIVLSAKGKKHYDRNPNTVVTNALRLLFLQPIRQDRRKIALLIDEIRAEVKAAGGVAEKNIDHLIKEYRQKKDLENAPRCD
jgi:hypothetical protein